MPKAAAVRATDEYAAGTPDADALMLRRVGEGDPAACRALVDRHLGSVVGLAYRLLGNRFDAEDVAQEAFLRLWRQAPHWQPRARLATWLYRVAYNLCLDRLRARRDPSADPAPDPIESPAAKVQRNEVARLVGEALDGLPHRQRAALALIYRRDLNNIEAAEVMGISVDAIESLLARGRQTLRRKLSDLRPDLMGEP